MQTGKHIIITPNSQKLENYLQQKAGFIYAVTVSALTDLLEQCPVLYESALYTASLE